jgi:magnesium-transporting ATPase (P-type)
MQNLLQPRVLKLAGIAALATAVACYPRLALWLKPTAPLWYLEATIFLGGIVLWSFVFAWHTSYSGRPIFTLKIKPELLITVTLAGIVVALAFHWFLDPSLRLKMPEDYPADLEHWFAMTLFSLVFSQMFLVFAPFAWLVRLFQNRRVAIGLTVLFGVIVLAIKTGSSPTPIPHPLFAALLAVRIVMGFLAVTFYLRGGVLLSWWWTFLVEARHLLNLAEHA